MWQADSQEWREQGSVLQEEDGTSTYAALSHSEGGPFLTREFGQSGFETEAAAFEVERPSLGQSPGYLGEQEKPCNCGCKEASSSAVLAEAEAYANFAESQTAENLVEDRPLSENWLDESEGLFNNMFIHTEAESPGAGGQSCTVDCQALPPKSVRPKGPKEGAVLERTEGDPRVNLALQLYAYDINAYHPIKERHAAALPRINEFISQRLIESTQDIAVTITGLATRTGSGAYNLDLSCKRAKCVAQNIRDSFQKDGPALTRVRMDVAGEGFTRSLCKGGECELDEWRAVLIQVHAPGDVPKPIPVVDPGWDKYAMRCCSFHTTLLTQLPNTLLRDLLKKGLPGIPDAIRSKLLEGLKKQLNQLLKFLESRSPKLKFASQALGELMDLFPAELIREVGVFQIRERRDNGAGRLVKLCYTGYGLRLAIPNDLDSILDLAFSGALKAVPDALKTLIKEALKSALPAGVKRFTKPIDSDTPGPFRNFDLRHPRHMGIFEGRVLAGEGVWMPGHLDVEFDSPAWDVQDPIRKPQIIPTAESASNTGLDMVIGDGSGLEFFSITVGNLEQGSCACTAPALESKNRVAGRLLTRSRVKREGEASEQEESEWEGESWLSEGGGEQESLGGQFPDRPADHEELEWSFGEKVSRSMPGEQPRSTGRAQPSGVTNPSRLSRDLRAPGEGFTLQPGQGPAALILYQWLHSAALREATVASLVGDARIRSVRVNGSAVSVPAYLHALGRLCHEAAEQSASAGSERKLTGET